MSSPHDTGEYPQFEDADVTIMSQTGNIWKLHHQTLSNSSAIFKELFAKSPSSKKSGIRWRIHMIDHPLAGDVDENRIYYKDFKPVSLTAKSASSFQPFAWSGMGEEPRFNKIYDNLFRCMYNLKPEFGSTQEGDVSMKESLNLLTAASYAKACPAVRLVIENHLLQFNQFLWYQVEHNPETWASTACKLHSAVILREAMIHLAGRYHLKSPESIRKNKLESVEWGKAIYELAVSKGRELKDYKLQVERRLMEFVPPRMLHPPVQQANGIVTAGRQVYAGDVYWWMCLHLIRQYFSVAVLQNRHHRADDGGIAFYRTIAAPHSYLLKDALNAFHEQFCMTPKSRVVFAHGLNELKKDFASIVEGLLVDHCQARRGLDAAPRVYLTCTVVLDDEMPWVEKPLLPQPPRRIRITDEDEEDIDEVVDNAIRIDEGRAAPLPSSSPSNLFISDSNRVPPDDHLVDNNTLELQASQGMNAASNLAASASRLRVSAADAGETSKRRHNSDIESDDDDAAPPAKKAKPNAATPTMPRFPPDGRMTSDQASVLNSGIHIGLIVGEELADINSKAEMSAAQGVPNMGGLVANPTVKPRGGFNQMLGHALAGGCGANARGDSTAGDSEAAEDGAEDNLETENNGAVENLESRPSQDGASKPTPNVTDKKAATQVGIESGPNPALTSKNKATTMQAPKSGRVSEVSSQETAGDLTQTTQTSIIESQSSVSSGPEFRSSLGIAQGGSAFVFGATTRTSSESTQPQTTPTPRPRLEPARRNVIAPTPSMPSHIQPLDTRNPTTPHFDRPREGTINHRQDASRRDMQSMLDPNSRYREAPSSQQPRLSPYFNFQREPAAAQPRQLPENRPHLTPRPVQQRSTPQGSTQTTPHSLPSSQATPTSDTAAPARQRQPGSGARRGNNKYRYPRDLA